MRQTEQENSKITNLLMRVPFIHPFFLKKKKNLYRSLNFSLSNGMAGKNHRDPQ